MECNTKSPTIMHVDINSCFATIEQQANPLIRGKPVAVAAYTTSKGCILAASVEAKRLGVRTGMPVYEGRRLATNLVVLPPDPDKYRTVNQQLRILLSSYTPYLSVESIDEMVLELAGSSAIQTKSMITIALEIKKRIREEIGEWIRVSIGIAPNRYLAKVASGLHKPDGLDVITKENVRNILDHLVLEDLCGIKKGIGNRLRFCGITTPLAFFDADPNALIRALHSITGYYWWRRLHGYEDGSMYKALDKEPAASAGGFGESKQKSFGQSYAFGKPPLPNDVSLSQTLSQLIMKMGKRLRESGCGASGIGISLVFTDYHHWGKRMISDVPIFADTDFYKRIQGLLIHAPSFPVRILAVWCYQLQQNVYDQQTLLWENSRKKALTQALDAICNRFGEFTVTPARMLHMEKKVLDRIAFGKC
jgi:DNA polymerase IV